MHFVPGLKDAITRRNWDESLVIVGRYLGIKSREFKQLQFCKEYSNTIEKAIEKGFIELIKLLIFHDLPINHSADGNNNTMVLLSAEYKQVEIMRLLLTYEGNVNSCDKVGKSPLHYAALAGQYDMVMLLLTENASVIHKDMLGNTALHISARKGYHKIVDLLMENDANINARNNNKETPLILAARYGHTSVVKCLLQDKYCDRDAKSCGWRYCSPCPNRERCAYIKTALEWAIAYGHQSIVNLLK